jgi:SAM-dependent methyltransferase
MAEAPAIPLLRRMAPRSRNRSTGDDVYGALLADALAGRRAHEVVERDDGYVIAFDARYLLAPFARWDDPDERRAMRFVRGRVLDVGCGGGRVCLHLQDRGLDVTGIDSSPGAIEVCRRRGVRDARLLAVEASEPSLGPFDTIVLLGQGFGALRSRSRARRLLSTMASIVTPRGRIVAETFDSHALDDPVHRRYRERNVRRGRMPGQLHVRIRHRELSTPWFDWLQVSQEELAGLLDGTPWRLTRTLGEGPSYVAIIDRV